MAAVLGKLPGMSTPAKRNLVFRQGATFRKVFTYFAYPYPVFIRDDVAYKESDGRKAPIADRELIDLTGCTARMHVRADINDATPLVVLTTENGRISLGGVNGTVALFVSSTDTALMTWKSGVYDLEISHPNGDVTRLVEGSASVSKEVTRG